MRDLLHVRERLCDAPLMVHERKLHAVLSGLAPRLGLSVRAFSDDDEWSQRQADTVRRPYTVTENGIALVPVVGLLVNRSGQIDADSTPLRSYAAIRSDLRMAMADPKVRGVVLDINSPGGEAAGVFELAREIVAMRDRKPIIAAVNAYAFSAAYAIAASSSHITILQGGGVGSIGCIAVHIDQTAKDAKDGLAYEFIQAGAKKSDGSSHKPLSDGARADITAVVERLYDLFVQQVAESRGLPVEAIRATEAGTFFGPDALAQRLAHQLGTLDDAVAEAARRADGQSSSTTRGTASRGSSSLEGHMPNPDSAAAADTVPGTTSATPTPSAQTGQPVVQPQQQQGTPAAAVALGAEDYAGIVELCTMAGQPALAAGFIRAGKSRGEVSEALLRGRAAGQQHTGTSTAHPAIEPNASRSSNPSDPHGWNASIERVFGKQGA